MVVRARLAPFRIRQSGNGDIDFVVLNSFGEIKKGTIATIETPLPEEDGS